MAIATVVTASADAGESVLRRLRELGFDATDATPPTADAAEAREYAAALDAVAAQSVIAAIAQRDAESRHTVAERLGAAASAAAADATESPLALVVLPAASAPLAGPVAVVTPAESVSAYELYVGAALASTSRRRVAHLNGRGTQGSAVHSGIAGRVIARAAAPEWREFPHAQPERSLHTLTSRPGAIVAAVPPGSIAAAQLIADHPDADIVLVFDRAHARHGAAVAQQVSSMVELAFSLGATAAPGIVVSDAPAPPAETADAPGAAEAPEDPASDLPAIRASDVVHVRLTDEALELTNRTSQRLRVHVALGDGAAPDVARAEFASVLEPRSARSEATVGVPGLEDLPPPQAVMRHWSHESEEVYEGGRRRILVFRIEVLAADGSVRAERSYRPGNGLDFFVTARDLTALIGRPVARSILPDPAPEPAPGTPPADLLSALASAVAVGAQVLTARAG